MPQIDRRAELFHGNGQLSEAKKIAESAKRRILHQPHLTKQRLWCEYHEGQLFLRGQVPSFYFKQLAQEAVIGSVGTASKPEAGKVQSVELLGFKGKVHWAQEAAGLRVQMPPEKLSDYSIALKIALA